MSRHVDHIKNNEASPISYSINIETTKRPLTCSITTDRPRISKQRTLNQLNYTKSSIHLEKTYDLRLKSLENIRRSDIHLPITYSTSIHVPCHPSTTKPRPTIILPLQSSRHHYHYYHHYHHHHHHHHHRQPPPPIPPRLSTTMKHKIFPQHASIDSSRPTTTSSTTTYKTPSPEPLLPSRLPKKNNPLSLPFPPSNRPGKQPASPSPPPMPSYSALVWNWFHHTPTRPQSHHKSGQSDYSETYRHELPSKRSLLLKLFTSPLEKQSNSKHPRTFFTRKHLESSSSSSLPNKYTNYKE